ncbi:MAG TPA: hypothetical protein V6C76_16705 [Drouetiella sp.]
MKAIEWIMFGAMCLFLGPLGFVAGLVLFVPLMLARGAANSVVAANKAKN